MDSFSSTPRIITAVTVVGGTLTIAGQPASAATFEVTTLNDVVDPNDGLLSLREAVDAAAVAAGADTITFAPNVVGQLELGLPVRVETDVNIVGPGLSVLTIKAAGQALYVYNQTDLDTIDVSVSGLTVIGSSDSAIFGSGNLNLTLDGVSLNSDGDGLELGDISALTVRNSTLSGNTGSGIDAAEVGVVLIESSFFNDNGDDGANFDQVPTSAVVRDSRFDRNGDGGLYVDDVVGDVTISGVFVNDNGVGGLYITDVQGVVTVTGVEANRNFFTGVGISDIEGGVSVSGVVASGTTSGPGLDLSDVEGDVVLSVVEAFGNGNNGVYVDLVDGDVTISAMTAKSNGGTGLGVERVEGDVVLSVVEAVGNETSGVYVDSVDGDVTISALAVKSNERTGLLVDEVDGAVTISGVDGSGNLEIGVKVTDVMADVAISDVTTDDNGERGLFASSIGGSTSVSGLEAARNSTGVYLIHTQGPLTVSDVRVSESSFVGLLVEEAESSVTISDVVSNENSDAGIQIINGLGHVSLAEVVANQNVEHGVSVVGLVGDIEMSEVITSTNLADGVHVEGVTGEVTVATSTANGNSEAGFSSRDVDGVITITESVADDNQQFGVRVIADDDELVLSGVAVARNRFSGVSIFAGGDMNTNIDGLTAVDNGSDGISVLGIDGLVTVTDSTITGGEHGVVTALYNNPQTIDVAISDVHIDGTSQSGMELATGATLLTDVEVTAAGGVGLDIDTTRGDASLDRVTLADNAGGALDVSNEGAVAIVNSTISGNGVNPSGAIVTFSRNQVDISHTTISGNGLVDPAQGVFAAGTATLRIDHSVITENGGAPVIVPIFGDTLSTIEYSLLPIDAGFSATNVESDVALLEPLANNGGATRTMLPSEDSPAIDAGDPAFVGPPLVDQRGAERVVDVVDIGAVEVAPVSVLTSLSPSRFVDTRAAGATIDDRYEAEGKRVADSEYRVEIAGRGDVPADAKAVIVNVTAVGAEDVGFVTVHPCSSERPLASSLNYSPGVNLANELIAPLSADGELCIYTSQAAHLLVDVVGFVEAGSPTVPLQPSRYLDTRAAGRTFDAVDQRGGPTVADGQVTLEVAGRGEVPADAAAVIVNVTAVGPAETGFVTVHPCADEPPNASSLNYVAGVNRANELIASVNSDGEICLFTSSPVHLLVDLVGYIPGGSSMTPIVPARFLDTRPAGQTVDGLAEREDKRPADSQYELQIGGRPGVPANATAVVVNVTAVAPEAVGFVTVHPCRDDAPNASSLNHVPGVNGANELIALLDGDGKICLYTSERTHLIVDVVAYIE